MVQPILSRRRILDYMSYVEPWMRGTLTELDPLIAALIHSFQHAREDLTKWTEGLPEEKICAAYGEAGSVGFHILHIGGSVERLLTYARGEQLSDAQMADLKTEQSAQMTRGELLAHLDRKLTEAETFLRTIDPATFGETRYIGRKRIPVTLGGLLVHTAEHTQRHVGEAIVTTKIIREQYR
jgi:uncharacterized damage-inducible protein DinB